MRIAVAGLHIECSSYNPALSRTEDFVILRGQELLEASSFRFLAEYDATFLPVFHARAVPGAPIARDVYEAFKAETVTSMAALGHLDGVYLAMHGAAFVEGMEDAEADFIGAVRDAVGAGVPIGASFDLHGNLSQPIIDALDVFSAYRTAPHIDVEATMRRAVSLLLRQLQGPETPVLCWAPIPIALPGERTSTVDEPANGLYRQLEVIEENAGIWDAALMVGYVWADEPRVNAAVVMTGTDRTAMEREARRLATAYWDARDAFVFGTTTGSSQDCVLWALAADSHPAVLADSGDNPTAGGAGDRADMLKMLIDAGATDTVIAGIADRPATEAAYAASIGARLDVSIGATIDSLNSKPVKVNAQVETLFQTDTPLERQAVLRIGGIRLVVTARRRPFHDLADFRRLGIEPLETKLLVVKSGYLSPELAAIANPSIMALSPGIVDQDIERLPRTRTRRPIYPLDRDFSFEPEVFWSKRSR